MRIAMQVGGDVPTAIVGDPVRLRQILLNLAGNAVKFTAGGCVDVEARVDSSALQLCVRDTGIGMTAEAMAQLFEPFEQADAATTRRFGGTGLGLSIVKRLAELMGGHVVCESTLGAGSRFTVTLPLVAAAMPVHDAPRRHRRPPAARLARAAGGRPSGESRSDRGAIGQTRLGMRHGRRRRSGVGRAVRCATPPHATRR